MEATLLTLNTKRSVYKLLNRCGNLQTWSGMIFCLHINVGAGLRLRRRFNVLAS